MPKTSTTAPSPTIAEQFANSPRPEPPAIAQAKRNVLEEGRDVNALAIAERNAQDGSIESQATYQAILDAIEPRQQARAQELAKAVEADRITELQSAIAFAGQLVANAQQPIVDSRDKALPIVTGMLSQFFQLVESLKAPKAQCETATNEILNALAKETGRSAHEARRALQVRDIDPANEILAMLIDAAPRACEDDWRLWHKLAQIGHRALQLACDHEQVASLRRAGERKRLGVENIGGNNV